MRICFYPASVEPHQLAASGRAAQAVRASRTALLTRTRKARITALLFPKKTAKIS
jgi:hypothetical protein